MKKHCIMRHRLGTALSILFELILAKQNHAHFDSTWYTEYNFYHGWMAQIPAVKQPLKRSRILQGDHYSEINNIVEMW